MLASLLSLPLILPQGTSRSLPLSTSWPLWRMDSLIPVLFPPQLQPLPCPPQGQPLPLAAAKRAREEARRESIMVMGTLACSSLWKCLCEWTLLWRYAQLLRCGYSVLLLNRFCLLLCSFCLAHSVSIFICSSIFRKMEDRKAHAIIFACMCELTQVHIIYMDISICLSIYLYMQVYPCMTICIHMHPPIRHTS